VHANAAVGRQAACRLKPRARTPRPLLIAQPLSFALRIFFCRLEASILPRSGVAPSAHFAIATVSGLPARLAVENPDGSTIEPAG
jgi:hypothetical protein